MLLHVVGVCRDDRTSATAAFLEAKTVPEISLLVFEFLLNLFHGVINRLNKVKPAEN